MFRLGLTIAGFIYKMSWKEVQKIYPKVSKTIFNQIKRYKNKKNLKDAFDKVEKKKIITKKKPEVITKKKPEVIKKKKHKVKYTKKTTVPTTVSTAKKISEIAKAPFKGGTAEIKALDKLLGNIPSTTLKYAW